jgi:hypothetical protein
LYAGHGARPGGDRLSGFGGAQSELIHIPTRFAMREIEARAQVRGCDHCEHGAASHGHDE